MQHMAKDPERESQPVYLPCAGCQSKWSDWYFDKLCECLRYANFYLMSLYTGWMHNHRWTKPKISIHPEIIIRFQINYPNS